MLGCKDDKHIDLDERGNPIMSLRTVSYYCEKEGLFCTPSLNDRLYLGYKGFTELTPTLSLYPNLTILFLNNNAIAHISHLQGCVHLHTLRLDHNNISSIQNLEALPHLNTLSLSHNKIEIIQHLSLPSLRTLSLANNFLHSADAVAGVSSAANLTSLDLSENALPIDLQTIQAISFNQCLNCLYLKATPLSTTLKNYRKTFISRLPQLQFLDDRTVTPVDHRLALAWSQGGIQAEIYEKNSIMKDTFSTQLMTNNIVEQFKENNGQREQVKQNNIQNQVRQNNKQNQVRQKNELIYVRQNAVELDVNQEKQFIQTSHKYSKKNIQVSEAIQYQQELDENAIMAKVKQVLGKREQNIDLRKWKSKYQPLLQALLIKYKFDFQQVQPSFNMVIKEVSKKLGKPFVRFQIKQLQIAWTQIQRERRNQ